MERVNRIRTLVPTFQLEFLKEPIVFDLVKAHFDRMVFVTKSIPIKKENEVPVLDRVKIYFSEFSWHLKSYFKKLFQKVYIARHGIEAMELFNKHEQVSKKEKRYI